MKQGKLQRVTTQFEMIRMEEDETFDEFYAKLNHIVNTSYTLGEPITPFRVVKKILRSLPARFKTKVDILESKRKLPEMSVEEIVGQFQNYELTHLGQDIISTKTFENSIAFSSKQNEPNDSDGDDNYDMEALDLFMKNFKHFFKKKNYKNENNGKKSKGKIEFSNSKERKGVKGPPSGPKCYECHGYGHLAQDCANKKMKQKVYNVKTWDDDSVSEKSESDRDEDSGKNYLAFAVKHQTDEKSSETEENSESEEEAVDSDDLQVAYNMLYKESLKIKKKYIKLESKSDVTSRELNKALSAAKESSKSLELMSQERDQLTREVTRLREKVCELEDLNVANKGKINDLSTELSNANCVFKRFNAGSKALDDILEVQRLVDDRSGLGYHASSSSQEKGEKVSHGKNMKGA